MGLGIEPDFEPPSIFEKNKVNLSGASATLIPREGTVHLVQNPRTQTRNWSARRRTGAWTLSKNWCAGILSSFTGP